MTDRSRRELEADLARTTAGYARMSRQRGADCEVIAAMGRRMEKLRAALGVKAAVACALCPNETTTSLCASCAHDLTALGVALPGPDASKDEVRAWARAGGVSVFACSGPAAAGEAPG